MPFKKGAFTRWGFHDELDSEMVTMYLVLQLAMPHNDPTVMIHPGYLAPLEYTDAMVKKHRQGVIMALIDNIQIICILAKHCPRLRPKTTDMNDIMLSVLSNATGNRILSKSKLSMPLETAELFGSKLMPMLYVVRSCLNKERHFIDMMHMVQHLGHAEREFQVAMVTGTQREVFKYTITKFLESLRAQLKKEGDKVVKTEDKEDVKKEGTEQDKEQDKDELLQMDEDGWPMFPKDNSGALQEGHEESLMRKATEDAARPCIAKAGDQ